jgi:hypothetical protein
MRAILVLPLALTIVSPAWAQTKTHQEMWQLRVDQIALLRAKPPLNIADALEEQIDVNRNLTGFALFAYAQSLVRELRLFEESRTDKQLSAPPGAGASTSLVSKGAVPGILGFAVEQGALTQTGDQTSVTLRGNAVGWLDLLKGQNFIDAYRDDAPFVRQLRRLSYSLTFNASPSEAESEERPDPEEIAAAAEASGRQVKSYSVRIALIDQRDPRSAANRASAQKLLDNAGAKLAMNFALFDPVLLSPEYQRWLADSRAALMSPVGLSKRDIERIVYGRLEALRQIMVAEIPAFDDGVAQIITSLRTFDEGRTSWFDKLQKRFLLSAEFVRNREPGAPASWTSRLIGEGRLGSTKWDLTTNAAVTHQDEGTAFVPNAIATKGWRDVQFALQAERPLGGGDPCACGSGLGRAVLSFEYLGRWLTERAVVRFAGYDFSADPGWIHAGQVKVTIPVKGSGVKIPLSVSFANRTELIREKSVRGHFGLTFDLDVLASAVRQ